MEGAETHRAQLCEEGAEHTLGLADEQILVVRTARRVGGIVVGHRLLVIPLGTGVDRARDLGISAQAAAVLVEQEEGVLGEDALHAYCQEMVRSGKPEGMFNAG